MFERAKVNDSDEMQRRLVTQLVLDELGLPGLSQDATGAYRTDHVWRGSKRTVELVFGNVRDNHWLHTDAFRPAQPDAWRLVIDHPFDTVGHSPAEDQQRIDHLRAQGLQSDTVIWVPHFLSEEKHRELRRLVIIEWVLASDDRWTKHADHLSETDRPQARAMLGSMRDGLRSSVRQSLIQAYDIASARSGVLLDGGRSENLLSSLNRSLDPDRPHGVDFPTALHDLLDKAFTAKWPGHPHFDPDDQEVRSAELRAVLSHLTRAMNEPTRRVQLEGDRSGVRRVANALEVGFAAETHFLFGDDRFGAWGTELQKGLSQLGKSDADPVTVGELRGIINALTPARGLRPPVADLVIHGWALLRQRAWFYHGAAIKPPEPGAVSDQLELRAQELPAPAAFDEAVRLAGVLFGINANPHLNANTVTALAAEVRERAHAHVADAGRLVQVLPPVLGRLGLDEGVPRLRTAHAAHDLVRRLSVLDGVELVRTLGTMRLDPQPEVIARSLTTVDTVVTALDTMTWKLVSKARQQASGDDAARALVKALADAVAANEFSVALAPVTKHVNDGLVDWIAGDDEPDPHRDLPVIDPVDDDSDNHDSDLREQVFTVVNRVGAEALVQQLQTFIDSHADRSIEVRWRLR